MTTKEIDNATAESADDVTDLERLNANLAKVEALSTRFVKAIAKREAHDPGLESPGTDLFMKATAAYFAEMMSNPSKIVEHQIGYWGKALKHYVEAQHVLVQGKLAAPPDNTKKDRRFSDPLWDDHPYFNYLKQQYLISSEAITAAVADLDHLSGNDKRRMEYFTRQIMDMFSPANFLGTNPEALKKAVETDGQSLVDGLENLVRDLEQNDGDLLVTLADPDAFEVGQNLATTEGKVVFRNRMFELIQYSPKTDQVRERPLVIFPPWINKYYILDLRSKNSFIAWVVEQGYTVFVVSWVNPGEEYREVGIDTYIEEGFLEAIAQVKMATGQETINAIGYCIAGTTLSLTLSLMGKRGDDSIDSATFFTMLTDFDDPGEVGAFLSDDFVDGIEREVSRKGVLDSFFMSRTFSFLRANDLVYKPAIKSYMMGETPPAFDLLYWNGDGTNLAGRMAVDYLRHLCQENRFAEGGIELCGETLKLSDIKLPFIAVACETDHIAPWKASFRGLQQMGSSDKTFILSESGHIAGIVNPPSKKKYGHYVDGDWSGSPEDWREGASFQEGTWWSRWEAWLRERSGDLVAARVPGEGPLAALADAPGNYVVAEPNV